MQIREWTIKFLPMVVICSFVTLSAPATWAASLWSGQGANLYAKPIRHWQEGDLVTVVILEQAQATQTAGTETQKKSGVEADLSVTAGIPIDAGEIELEGGDTLKAQGKTTRGGTLKAQITAKVLEILPSGLLKIEGKQTILVNGERQEIVFSGLVRPDDISTDNAIYSTHVADAEISFRGVGSLASKQGQGLLTRFFHWLF